MTADLTRHDADLGGLCEECAKMMSIASIGKCEACGGYASSGSYRLCRQCSDRRNECMACGTPLVPKKD